MIKQTTTASFNEDMGSNLTLIDFGAPWCGFCKKIEPELEEVNQRIEGLTILKVNTDIDYELAEQFGVEALPTLVLLKDGKEVKRQLGFMTAPQIEEFINQ